MTTLPPPASDLPAYDRDEPLLHASLADGHPHLAVYRPGSTQVVLGRGSRAEVELDVGACAASCVPLLRRRGGGCAVLLDPGNVVVSLALAARGIGDNPRHFRRITDWLLAALTALGISGMHQEGISDLALQDRKVGGACIYRTRGLLFYTTTLLVTPDLETMIRCLRHPPREPAYRRGRPHADFVRPLHPGAWPGSAEALEHALREVLRPPGP